MTEYKKIITNKGLELITSSSLNGEELVIKSIVIGDANGENYEPTAAQTSLVHQKNELQISEMIVNSETSYTFLAQIPNDIDYYIIREIGLLDENDNLLEIAQMEQETYIQSDNLIQQLTIGIRFDVGQSSTVVVLADTNIEMASKDFVNDNFQKLNKKNQANGYAGLNENGKLPLSKLSSTNLSAFTDDLGSSPVHTHSQYLNNSQITNCIIETPNNLIWEDITNGVRLKAGSVVTFPDGFKEDGTTRKFKKIVLESDIDSTYTGSSSGQVFLCLRPYNDTYTLSRFGISTAVCGDSSTPMTTGLLYNETTNTIQNYNSGSYQYDTSFPLGIFDLSSKKLIQSFNCFGFIGVGTFILDGAKYLIADGRNENGDLKNNLVTISKTIINVGSSGTGLENYKAASIVTTSLNYIKTTRVYYVRKFADLPTISENARNMGFVEETNKWYQIHRTGGIDDWTESTYYVIPMCDFKYDSSGAYIESCSVPRVEPLINSSNADGQWVASYKEIITNGTPPTLADVSFDLSSYLPNDGYNYEVLFSTVGITGNVSGNSIVIILHTDLQPYNVYLCSTKTRTSSTFYGSGSVILPVGSGRRVDVNYNSSNSGSYDLYALGYRRLGINQ